MRVLFGGGCRGRLDEELESLGVRNALIIVDPAHRRLGQDFAEQLGSRCAGVFDGVAPHVPIEVAEKGRAMVREVDADCCVTVGGGSAIGLGKAIAMEISIPLVAVPTTYAGSEMTPIWGLTEGGLKRTGRDPKVQPRVSLYDPELTLTLPPAVAGPSGINALAHCVEALYAENANPVVSLLAEEGVRALAASLPGVVAAPDDLETRAQALYGAWLAGISLGSVGMALHHKLCHVLGGTFNTPHAQTHAVILPYATAYNLDAAPEAKERLTSVLATGQVAGALRELSLAVGAPESLRALGLTEQDLETAADLAVQSPYYNPREVTRDGVHRLLLDAYRGVMP